MILAAKQHFQRSRQQSNHQISQEPRKSLPAKAKSCWKGLVVFGFAGTFLLMSIATGGFSVRPIQDLVVDKVRSGECESSAVGFVIDMTATEASEAALNGTEVNNEEGGGGIIITNSSSSTTEDAAAAESTTPPPAPLSPVLPRRQISVFGLESSGTTFAAKMLAMHAGVKFREGLQGGRRSNRLTPPLTIQDMEVLHVSQPWGLACGTPDIRDEIMPVLYPQHCVYGLMDNGAFDAAIQDPKRLLDAGQECINVGAYRDYSNHSKVIYYPKRFFVNVTSHVQWYRERGVDATAVIVSRDKNIGHAARYHGHCTNETKALEEEKKGLALLSEALEKLPQLYQRTDSNSTSPPVVLVSYEQMVLFGNVYIQKILQELGLPWNPRHGPNSEVKDGNAVYVKSLEAVGQEKKGASHAKRIAERREAHARAMEKQKQIVASQQARQKAMEERATANTQQQPP
eukprot:CAMPEP_0194032912 /NCGR_PEP_ID=MMETSP0009_2-20130614/5754_1 /TAXON_ID=210454 /ORGANISM="Grammatophora oceanica, Strain CCMP 410" /LENGTH=457 /DNA_ID=CAMNT_0038673489 /DNA_START=143 /DNA_END=1516 /DNA_ORIENTATION=-